MTNEFKRILPPKCKRFLKRCIHAKLVIEIDTSGWRNRYILFRDFFITLSNITYLNEMAKKSDLPWG